MSPLLPKAVIQAALEAFSACLKGARKGHSASAAMGEKLKLATGRHRLGADPYCQREGQPLM